MLRPDVAAGLWRVSCWGGDDTSYVLRGLTRAEAEAEAAWARLTPHVTVRTIRHVLRFGE